MDYSRLHLNEVDCYQKISCQKLVRSSDNVPWKKELARSSARVPHLLNTLESNLLEKKSETDVSRSFVRDAILHEPRRALWATDKFHSRARELLSSGCDLSHCPAMTVTIRMYS